jgi:hypothetical protein
MTHREFLAKGITDYQSFVYPYQFGGVFLVGNDQHIPIYSNIASNNDMTVTSWNWSIFTSNATASLPSEPQDVNNVIYYPKALQLHGRHDLVVSCTNVKEDEDITEYEMFLSGLDYYQSLDPNNSQVAENVLSNDPDIIAWTTHFLVVPHTEPFYDDMTRLLGLHAIKVPKNFSIYCCTRATSIFQLPDGTVFGDNPTIPLWTLRQDGGAVLNVAFLFVGKLVEGSTGSMIAEVKTPAGNPSGTKNDRVAEELLLIPTDQLK